MSHRHHLIGLIAAALLLGAGASAGLADVDYYWDANGAVPPNGIFGGYFNWDPDGVPGEYDDATFNLDDTYTVTFTDYEKNRALTCSAGDVTMTSDGSLRTYEPLGASVSAALTVDNLVLSPLLLFDVGYGSAGYTSSLLIRNGGIMEIRGSSPDGYVNIGSSLGCSGEVIVDGAGSSWLGQNADLTIGDGSTGSLTIRNGGYVSNRIAYLGRNNISSEGTVTVEGTGSQWSVTSAYVGGNETSAEGTGTLTVSDGGTVTVQDTLKVWPTSTVELLGSQINTGSFVVEPGGTFTHTAGTLTIDGGVFDPGTLSYGIEGPGNPTLKLINGASASLGGDLAWLSVAHADQGTLILESGASFSDAGGWIGGAGAEGAVTVDGPGSTWTNIGELGVGWGNPSSGGVGQLTISNGGAVSSAQSTLGYFADDNGTVTVTGSGSSLTMTNSGPLSVGAYGTGHLTISNGAAVLSGRAWVGMFSGSHGTVLVEGAGSSWTNSGSLDVDGGAAWAGGTAEMTVHNHGAVTVGETLTVWGPAGTVNLLGGGTLSATTIDHTHGGTFNFTGGRLHVGTFMGNLTNNGGSLCPGASAGTTTIQGDYIQAAGALQIELGGTTPGTEYDVLEVTGAATLGGMLVIWRIDAFTPQVGDEFEIVTYASRTGEFTGTVGWLFDDKALVKVYGPNDLTLFATYQGDANLSLTVDLSDLIILANNWQQSPRTWFQGDFTGDWSVNLLDLIILANNWEAGGGQAPVPEPTALGLIVAGAAWIFRRRRP